MKRSKYSEEQIIGLLKQSAAGAKTGDLCRQHGISAATFYAWRSKYGGLEVDEARRLKQLEEENSKLKADRGRSSAGYHDVEGSGWKKMVDRRPRERRSRTYCRRTVPANGALAGCSDSRDPRNGTLRRRSRRTLCQSALRNWPRSVRALAIGG